MASLKLKGKKVPEFYCYITVGGLNIYNQLIINKYIEILSPFKKAISLVEGKGKASKYGMIQEVIPIFNQLFRVFKEKKNCVAKAIIENYPNQEAIEDYFIINLNAVQAKLNKYYLKLNNILVYYTAVLLYLYFKCFCQNIQKDRPDWIISSNANF